MVYSKELKNQHWDEILNKFFDFKKGYVKVTTADLKSIIGDKEIRLLNYYDSEKTMPTPLQTNNIMLFPITTSSWWLVKCDGFMDLKEITSPIVKHKSKTKFITHSSTAGMGEQQYLLNVINSKILDDFLNLNNKTYYFTIMGKQRSKGFELNVGGKKFPIDAPGIEIDAGFEGKDYAIVVEAKAKLISRFNKRQFYFPYMHVKKITGKKTIPVYFCWDDKTKTYHLWRFKIIDDNFEKFELLDSKRYSLEQSTLKDF